MQLSAESSGGRAKMGGGGRGAGGPQLKPGVMHRVEIVLDDDYK